MSNKSKPPSAVAAAAAACGIHVGRPDQVEDRFKCNLCQLVLCEPVQGSCGHRYCRDCIAAASPVGIACVACKAEGEEDVPQLTAATVLLDPAIALELKRAKFYCRWERCDVQLPLSELKEHMDSLCEHRQVPCELCGKEVPYSEMEQHEKKCPKRSEQCENCKNRVPLDEMDRHLSTECVGSTKQCQSCTVRVRDTEGAWLIHAANECPVGWVNDRPCPYGCDGGKPLADAQKHRAERLCQHIDLSLAALSGGAKASVEESAAGSGATGQQLALESGAAAEPLEEASPLAIVESRLSHAEIGLSLVVHGLPYCPTDAGNVRERDAFFDRVTGAFRAGHDLEKEHRSIEQKLQDVDRSMEPLMRAKELEYAELSKASDMYSEAVRAMAMKEIRICDLERRITLQEIGSTDGTLVWRIPFFRERLASTEYEPIVVSPILFTERFGYKLNAVAYLNGHNTGRDSHVSLYVRLLKGPFDAAQQWPFKQRVTITLMDQTSPTGHLVKTYQPDQSSQFQRPSQPQGQPFGFDKFVAKEELETRGFLKDDTAFVKLHVARLPLAGSNF